MSHTRQPGGGVEVPDTLSRIGNAREKRVRRTLSFVEVTGNTISRFRPDSPVRPVTYRWRPAGLPGRRSEMRKRTSLGQLRLYRAILLRHQRHCGPQIHYAMTLMWWQRKACLRILRLTAGADC